MRYYIYRKKYVDIINKCIFRSKNKEDCSSMLMSGIVCDKCPFYKMFLDNQIASVSSKYVDSKNHKNV